MMEFFTGYKKSPEDSRDYIFSNVYNFKTETLPSSFSLPNIKVSDQGDFGTCVGHAAAYVKAYQELKNSPGADLEFSPLFIYNQCKKLDGIPEEEGTYPRTAMAVLKDYGSVFENDFPYNLLENVKNLPAIPEKLFELAKEFKISSYARIQTVQEMKAAIYSGSPVLIGLIVASNFMKPEKNKFIDHPGGAILGGHAVSVIGWDDNMVHTYSTGVTRKGFVKFINSWNSTWGDNGYAYLPYSFIEGKVGDLGLPYVQEAWSSVDIIMPPRKPVFKKKIELWIDKKEAIVDGKKIILDQAPKVDPISNRTLVPLTFLSEQLGCKVEWDRINRKITITQK